MSQPDPTHLIAQSQKLAENGQITSAKKYIRQALALKPDHITAWFHWIALAESRAEAEYGLAKVKALHPTHPQLPKIEAWLNKRWPISSNQPKPKPKLSFWWVWLAGYGISIVMVLLCLVLGLVSLRSRPLVAEQNPQLGGVTPTVAMLAQVSEVKATATTSLAQILAELDAKIEQSDEPETLEALLTDRFQLDPADLHIAARLADLYYQRGLGLRDSGQFRAAREAFRQALDTYPVLDDAKRQADWADLMLQAQNHSHQNRWGEAVVFYETVYQQNSQYPFVIEALYQAYFNLGVRQREQGQLESALQYFEQASNLRPDSPASQNIVDVHRAINPPTPTPIPPPTPRRPTKRIVVDISEQRTYLYENGQLAHAFISSTGEPGRETAPGQYEILNKIPMAYASTWNLDMPNWLGVYWAGNLQNGFHGPPTVRYTGVTMWEGFIGQPISYGCIILSHEDSATLYAWAEVGVPVTIQY